MLFEPLGEAIPGKEIVHGQADPAGSENDDGGDNLAHEGDGLLEDVDDGEDCENNANNVNECCHILVS